MHDWDKIYALMKSWKNAYFLSSLSGLSEGLVFIGQTNHLIIMLSLIFCKFNAFTSFWHHNCASLCLLQLDEHHICLCA